MPDASFHTQMRLIELHVASAETSNDESKRIFTVDDLLAVYDDRAKPQELRLACLLACGHERGASTDALADALHNASDVSMVVGAAIALLRRTQWMDEKATVVLQKLLHEPRDIEAKVICLRIVGKELPELLGNGYLVYLLHETQAPSIGSRCAAVLSAVEANVADAIARASQMAARRNAAYRRH